MKKLSDIALVIFILTISFAGFQKVNAMVIDSGPTGALGKAETYLKTNSSGMLGGEVSKLNKEVQSVKATLQRAVAEVNRERTEAGKKKKQKRAEAIYQIAPIVIKSKVNLGVCVRTKAQLKKRYTNINNKIKVLKKQNIAVPPAVQSRLEAISKNITLADQAISQTNGYLNRVTPDQFVANPKQTISNLTFASTGVKTCKQYIMDVYRDTIAVPSEFQPVTTQ